MAMRIRSLRTKVAQRIFILFIICAVMPIAALAWVSFVHVKNHLIEQSEMRMQQETKAMALSLFEQLSLLSTSMRLVASNFNSFLITPRKILHKDLLDEVQERFAGMAVFTDQDDYTLISGQLGDPPILTLGEQKHINAGHVLLSLQSREDASTTLFLYTYLDPDRRDMGQLVGEVRMESLRKVADARSPETELTVLDQKDRILFSTFFKGHAVPPELLEQARIQRKGIFQWAHNDVEYMVSRLSLPLRSPFYYPGWTVVMTASREALLAPIGRFERSFPVIIILSLGMVFVLSLILIRKNLTPIEVLKEATQRIAEGGTGYQTVIESGDEFEELGSAFNEMSRKLKETQELLVRGEKMSTMGQMAAGMIHEIKQPLTALHGLLQASIIIDKLSDESKERLTTALEAVKRLDMILQKFSTFSYVAKEKMEVLSINTVIDQVYRLLEHQMGMKRIECYPYYHETPPPIYGDKQALQQVFSNLIMNAIHVLEERDNQRRIDIRVFSFEGNILVEIEDNGKGIPKDMQKKIFDPFFTTKGADRGTGLGMVIVESILHKHRARIELESEVGEGTTFRITFPPASGVQGKTETPEPDQPPEAATG